MCASALQRSTSSFDTPTRSLPNTSAMAPGLPPCPWPVNSQAFSAAARGAIGGGPYSRDRAVSAIDQCTPFRASASVSTTCADASTSSAPLAIATASGSRVTNAIFGATTISRENPIVLSARAAAPTLPGWLGSTSTKRVEAKTSSEGFEEEFRSKGKRLQKVERDVMVSPRSLSGDITCSLMPRCRPTRVKYAVRVCPLLFQVAVFSHYF